MRTEDQRRKYDKQKKGMRDTRKANGLCIYCGDRNDRLPLITCSSCYTKTKIRRKEYMGQLFANKKCPDCGANTVGKVKCTECQDKINAHGRSKRVNRKLNHLCMDCGVPHNTKYFRCDECHERHSKQNTILRNIIKSKVMDHYGNRCTCCGDDTKSLLTIDHINGDGSSHKREISPNSRCSSTRLYKWIIRNKYPKNFQILCSSCNLSKHINGGECEHNDTILTQYIANYVSTPEGVLV